MAYFDQPSLVLNQLRDSWRKHDDSDMCRMIINDPSTNLECVSRQAGPPASPLPQIRKPLGSRFQSIQKGQKLPARRAQSTPLHQQEDVQCIGTSVGIEAGDIMVKKTRTAKTANPLNAMTNVTREVTWEGQKKQNKKSQTTPFQFELKFPQKTTAVSSLSQLMNESRAKSQPFEEYSRFNGEGHLGSEKTVQCKIFLFNAEVEKAASTENMKPVCEQDVCVLRSAQVHDLVGVFLWKCHEENKVGGDSGVEIDQKGVDAYELRDIEDGVPSLDWPPLPGTQDLSKFAFDTMAMVRVPRKEKKKIKKEYVVVTTPGGRSTVPIDLDCTVSELLKMLQKRRALSKDDQTKEGDDKSEYCLEMQLHPGQPLNVKATLRSFNTLEFVLIHKHSKRMDDFEPSDTHQKEQSAEKNEREEKFKTYTSESFAVYKKMNIFGKKEEMVFVIEGDKLSIIPTIMDSTNSWTPRSTWNDLRMAHGRHTPQKLLYYNMDDVVRACLVPEKSDRTFQFVVASKKPVTGMTEYNTHEFETKRVEDVARVIRKMDRILNTRKSEARTNYDAYLEAQEAAPKRRWV